ncbi:hypothetical protein NK718_16410 [Alsobacter sp. SYSU M60028]|uniref:Sulphotransferase Stf0 domain-containing protein n=1 Tax=Alsobacter ponti TaxID=2962936 RepID=A0ABT1LF48_9HYPH|nr:hypothetical protein [Alsobacter ponti]MCP8940111.1 hypothetical protein [Alsobacter ponti]
MKSHHLRRASYLLRIAAGRFGRPEVPRQHLVFTLTDGRSGSGRLAHLFDGLEAVTGAHEPEPRFDALLRDVQRRPGLARDFLRFVKLPAIATLDKPVYVETSHVFGKGFFDAALDLGLPMSLIVLRRDLRKIALSLLRIGAVPGRTRLGERFLLRPEDALCIGLSEPARLSDYQLCYWHAHEMQARQELYAARARAAGLRVVEVENDALGEPGVFETLLAELDIPVSDADRAWIETARDVRVNEKRAPGEAPFREPERLDEQEEQARRAFVPMTPDPALSF